MTRSFIFFYRNKFVLTATLVLVATFLSLYVLQINSLTQLAYEVADHEDQIQETRGENKTLEVQAIQTHPRDHLENLAHSLGFEQIQRVRYLEVTEGTVAQNAN